MPDTKFSTNKAINRKGKGGKFTHTFYRNFNMSQYTIDTFLKPFSRENSQIELIFSALKYLTIKISAAITW